MRVLVLLYSLIPLYNASFLSSLFHHENHVMLTIPQGKLRGSTTKSQNGRTIHSFTKIPYAAPPVGDLRFQPPQEADQWEGTRDATKQAPPCIQQEILLKSKFLTVSGQEDCLYLNVYTPEMDKTEGTLLPVMVWIHGGAFVEISGNNVFFPPDILLDRDIVLVTINYRLGPLGFVSMEDNILPGNNGLKDQSFALKWVKENVGYFGGDPNLVTIFGQSAGAVSVHYHMLSPMSRGLFQRAISQSGTVFSPWGFSAAGYTKNHTIQLGEFFNCPTQSTDDLVLCLRTKSAKEIITTALKFQEWSIDPLPPFRPVVERNVPFNEAFLPDYPERIIALGQAADVPWILGSTSGDGALRVAAIYDKPYLVRQLNQHFEQIAPIALNFEEKVAYPARLAREVRNYYFGDEPIGNATRLRAVDLWTDNWFLAGEDKSIRLHKPVMSAPIYYYWFNYRGSVSFSTAFGDATRDYGVTHTDDVIYLFPQTATFPNHKYNEKDKEFMKILPRLWTDFATYGDPTPQDSPYGPWTPVETESIEYFNMSKDELSMGEYLLPERTALWRRVKYEYGNCRRTRL